MSPCHTARRHPRCSKKLSIRDRPCHSEFARVLTGSAAVPAVSVDTLAQIWNDDASFWSNLRTLEYWTDRARR